MDFVKYFNKFFMLFGGFGLILGSLITACGSSDSTGSTQTGTVALLLTDGPTEEFSKVNVTVNEVSLLSDGGEPVILFSGERRIDLLALQEVEDLFMIHEGVPASTYNKIRLRVSDPEFFKIICDPIDQIDPMDPCRIPSTHIHLVAGGKVDLVPEHPFQVSPGETLVLRLDLDAEKSILIHLSSAFKYQFRPVVFVEVLDKMIERTIFVDGEVVSISTETRSFLLRRSHPIFHDLDLSDKPIVEEDNDTRHLIRVVVSEDTRIFEASGLPGSFDSLAVGQHVNVRGLFSFEDGFRIQARLIEIGEDFIRLHGSIVVGVDDPVCDRFILRVDSVQMDIPVPDPQSIQSGVPLPITEVNIEVQLHNETLIFEAGTHKRLTCGDLVTGKRVLVEGVLDRLGVPTEDLIIGILHAAVIVVKPDKAELIDYEGSVHELNLEERTFRLAIILPCEPLCLPILQQIILVHVLPEAVIIRIHSGKDGHLEIEPIPFESIKEGDRVHVFGQFDTSGSPFHAQVVVVETESERVSFETIAHGVRSGIAEERLMTIRDETTWNEFWELNAGKESSVPSVDFEKKMVIVVHLGTKSSGGYDAVITHVEHTDARLIVYYNEIIPGPGCLVTLALTQPHHIIKVQRMEVEPSFVKTEQVIHCRIELS